MIKKFMFNPNNKSMSLVRYNSLNDYSPVAFSNLFDRFFTDAAARNGGSAYSFVPRVDIFEEENAFEIHVAVAGMMKNDFKIDLNKNQLTISGERKINREKKANTFQSVEIQHGTFSRSFSLPDNVDATTISAKYVDGILEVSVPKDEKKVLKQTIKVS